MPRKKYPTPVDLATPSLDEQVEALAIRPKEEDMAVQQTFVGRAKSIAGAALIGLGILVFYENLHQAATQFSHLLGVIPSEAPGGLPTAIMAAYRVLQTYCVDHPRPLQGCLLHMLASSWPLLLVIVGTVLSRDCSTDNVSTLPKKRLWTCRSDCRSFDIRGEVRLTSTQKEK